MITLITGLPGNGKSLYAIWTTKARAEKEARQVYYNGVKDCNVPGWIELENPEDWHKCPAGSIVLLDEVQRSMRPRMHGSNVPEHIAKLETHRHNGIDLVLITQDAMLLDNNARRLVGQHFHVVRNFGLNKATIHEWSQVKETAAKNREDSQARHEWLYPKDAFALYKSAEVHTHKRRIPLKVWVLLSLPFIIGALSWYAWSRLDPNRKKDVPGPVSTPAAQMMLSGNGKGSTRLDAAEYTAQFQPRVAGLAYTAPVYEEVTKPVVAPYPAACVSTATRCQCYTQQGTKLETGMDMCRSIADGGFFVAWAQPIANAVPLAQPASEKPVMASAGGSPGLISLGGDPLAHVRRSAPAPVVAPDLGPENPGRGRNLPSKTTGPL